MVEPSASRPPGAHIPLLVGREREQALLRDHLVAALAGRGGLILISGEAGIGKTALAEALAREAAGRGTLVLVGRCYDLAETPPYGPWVELFEQLPAGHDRSSLPVPLGAGEAATSQVALVARLRDHLAAAANRRPLVLVLEDLHWADPASLDTLRHLARGVAALPALVLATYRADELDRHHPLYQLLPVLAREARAERLDLRPLADADLRALVHARYRLAGHDAARLVAYLRERAEGNPFYAGELLRSLEEEGHLRPGDDGWQLGDLAGVRLPALLRQVIDRRLLRLGEEGRGLLEVAAVIGQEVPLDLWLAVHGGAEDALMALVERAASARLLDEAPDGARVRFHHALTRAALYEGLAAARRRGWHRRVAETLLATPRPDPDVLAHHLRQAGDPRAAEWLVRAGERAEQAYAWLTAAERFAAALALMEERQADARERAWLLLRLALLVRYTDQHRSGAALVEATRLAADADDPVLTAYARYFRGMLGCFAGDFRRGLPELEAGAAALDTLPAAEGAPAAAPRTLGFAPGRQDHWGLCAMFVATAGHFARAAAIGARAVAGAATSTTGPQGTCPYGDAHHGLALVHIGLGRPDEASRALEQARAAYQSVGHHVMVALVTARALHWVALQYRAEELTERERLAAEAEGASARATGATGYPARLARVPLLLLEGQWAEARPLMLAGLTPGGNVVVRVWAASLLAQLAREQGEAESAWAVIGAWLPEGPATEPGGICLVEALVCQRAAAALARDAGDLETARAWLAAHDRWLAWSGAVLGQAEGQLGWAAYHRAAGDLAQARRHAEQALAHATEPRQPLALLAAHRLLGELETEEGRHARAAAHLGESLALAEACAAPYERALTLLALAELHAATGDGDEARGLLDEVRAICAPLEARPALARADALAARLVEAPVAGPAYPAGLSAREVEVLRLIVAGHTNREIAAALHLSTKTVVNHVTHILMKIGAGNRTAAAAFALRHGLA